MRNVGLKVNSSTHDGKSRGSESCGRSEVGATRLRGVFTGEDDGNAIGDELPSENASDTFEGVVCVTTYPQKVGFAWGCSFPAPFLQLLHVEASSDQHISGVRVCQPLMGFQQGRVGQREVPATLTALLLW